MARITISQAAKEGFASRPTLYRALKDGRLTAHPASTVQHSSKPKPPRAPRSRSTM
ncbi:MAG: hypothetical protein V3S40_06370 [Kiloniellales bacterium]